MLLKAVTGLEGGCVANGSTCGIATGGALGIALQHEAWLQSNHPQMEEAVIQAVGDYMNWFRQKHGTTQCGERNNVDFHKVTGQLRYFLSIPKIMRCILMCGRSIQHLTQNTNGNAPPAMTVEPEPQCEPLHCATEVLKQVRETTGVGYHRLERLSVVFDGGIGLAGMLCGAVIGAVLSINFVHGFDLRRMSYSSNVTKFLVGHISLLRNKAGQKPDTFFLGKQMVNQIRETTGAIDCRAITGKRFSSIDDFQNHMQQSGICRNLIHTSASLAAEVIQQHGE